jgi:HlyD family secretion protein
MISECSVGDILPLVVDSAPEQKFDARIITISDEPEYTTRQSQNNAERAAAVYAVTLQIENPDNLLRPGLPADVLLEGK